MLRALAFFVGGTRGTIRPCRAYYLGKSEQLYGHLHDEVDPLEVAGAIPDALGQHLELLRQVRLHEVRLYATRKLGYVSPDTLEEVTRILRDADADADAE